MLTSYWQHFKSGTDIRGVALDGVEGQPLDLTDEVVEKLAAAFARWLSGKSGKPAAALTISLGRDSRLSRPREMVSAAAGLPDLPDSQRAKAAASFSTTSSVKSRGWPSTPSSATPRMSVPLLKCCQ